MLINLAANATKFADEGGITLHVTAHESPVRFDVIDTGIGMSPAQVELAFEAFGQPHSPQSRGVSGTGLGLTISRALVDQMGGRISVESEVGKGSRFTVQVPIEPPQLGV